MHRFSWVVQLSIICCVVSISAPGKFSKLLNAGVISPLQRPQRPCEHTLEQCDYKTYTLENFTVRLHGCLDKKLQKQLTADLRQINRLLPTKALLKLQKKTKIYISDANYDDEGHPRESPCCHLTSEKKGCVQFPSIEGYYKWTKSQPAVLLHELAHAYHIMLKAEKSPLVKQIDEAYRAARLSNKYKIVKHISGTNVEAYALTNVWEYFSETSEAFFSTSRFRNEFYPFVNSELKAFDPIGYQMMQDVWGVDMAKLQPLLGAPEGYKETLMAITKNSHV